MSCSWFTMMTLMVLCWGGCRSWVMVLLPHALKDSLATKNSMYKSVCTVSKTGFVCCIHQEVTRKMAVVHWPQWGGWSMWNMLKCNYAAIIIITACVPGEPQSFLNNTCRSLLLCAKWVVSLQVMLQKITLVITNDTWNTDLECRDTEYLQLQ